MAPYAVLVPYPNVSTTSPAAVTSLHNTDESHEEKYGSYSGGKLGGAVECPADDEA